MRCVALLERPGSYEDRADLNVGVRGYVPRVMPSESYTWNIDA